MKQSFQLVFGILIDWWDMCQCWLNMCAHCFHTASSFVLIMDMLCCDPVSRAFLTHRNGGQCLLSKSIFHLVWLQVVCHFKLQCVLWIKVVWSYNAKKFFGENHAMIFCCLNSMFTIKVTQWSKTFFLSLAVCML
jgi:hypothetical protein